MDATEILQTYLDHIADAVMTNDWESYVKGVALPFHLVTHRANVTLTTVEDLRAGFDGFRQTLQTQRVTQYIRLVDHAKRVDRDLISGSYVTHLMAGAHRILEPYSSQITLRLHGDLWQAASITNSLANARWPLLVPSVSPNTQTEGPKE